MVKGLPIVIKIMNEIISGELVWLCLNEFGREFWSSEHECWRRCLPPPLDRRSNRLLYSRPCLGLSDIEQVPVFPAMREGPVKSFILVPRPEGEEDSSERLISFTPDGLMCAYSLYSTR